MPPAEISSAPRAAQSAAPARAESGAPRRETVRAGGAEIAVFHVDGESPGPTPLLIWAHGWGHTHRAFLGLGDSRPPPAVWGTADYADAVAEWLATLPAGRRVWIGHSFGCRVGLQLAARHLQAVEALFLIAAHGLQPYRS